MDHRTNLIQAKNLFCERTGLAAATAGSRAANDGKFFDRIESGKNCTMETYERVMAWFKENTPPPGKNQSKRVTRGSP